MFTHQSIVIEPVELSDLLSGSGNQKNLLVVDLCQRSLYQQLHVPGAVYLDPKLLLCGRKPVPNKLPSREQLQQVFQSIGFSGHQKIVVYDDEGGGWAGRFVWTLDAIGYENYAYLNGGIHAWMNEKLPVSHQQTEPGKVERIALQINNHVIASADYIQSHLNDPEIVLWDSRSIEEYRGKNVFGLRGGHIPGAVYCDWRELMDFDRYYRIRSDAIGYLQEKGIGMEKEVIVYCQSHHRSGFSYLVARAMGYKKLRAYDGSWAEWGNNILLPVENNGKQ
ncbi:Thiosulfate sulfurtransferase [invertebrate metagenome]|uniref:Thiosulfate sulfurtransferase n=1 Tax=invertebrate metagenome TaxID=1711999 RepID=A0A2H9T9A5_9ZZZZ